jgi:hypothetical protein
MKHDICIPNTYYVQKLRSKIAAAKKLGSANDNYCQSDGTWCVLCNIWRQSRNLLEPTKAFENDKYRSL